jgi:pyridoxal phosphate enzyme (YggS family)
LDFGSKYNEILTEVRKSNPAKEITLIAVSKKQSYSVIRDAYLQGIRVFGENYIPEGIEKFTKLREEFPDAIASVQVHHIGPVQSGSLRKLFGTFAYTHGVGSVSSLKELVKKADKEKKTIRYFIQLNLTLENTKSGLTLSEFQKEQEVILGFQSEYCIWEGFMVMGPSSRDLEETKRIFEMATSFRDKHFPEKKLSMGMSGDYKLAVSFGSEYLRVGSLVFGERNYEP